MKQKLIWAALPLLMVLNSCNKNDVKEPTKPPAKGVYVLNEGGFNQNNALLGFYALANNVYTSNYYASQNPTASPNLGDIASDMIIYGAKLYIVVNNSNRVTVLNAATGALINHISFAGKQPRYALGTKGRVFITAYDGTVNVVDTNLLTITKSIAVGLNPEGITQSGDNLYVANSGGFNYPVYDSTVSVISLSSLTETAKIKVSKNPIGITADDNGNVYVACSGDYGAVAPSLVKINAATNQVLFSADTAAGVIRVFDGKLYATGGFFGPAALRQLSTTDFSTVVNNFITDGTNIEMPYGFNFDEANGDVYILDAKNFVNSGEVFCFDKNGHKKFNFSCSPGTLPNKVQFVR